MFKIQLINVVTKLRFIFLLALTLAMQTFSLSAQSLATEAISTGWLTHPDHPPAQVRFMLTGEVDVKNKQINGLLEVKLDGDWKTYWRSPGEGGVSPILDWRQSSNLSDLQWHWPTPAYYEQLGVKTLGYKHNVTFPMTLTVDDMNQPLHFLGKLTLPTCTNICVLSDYDLDLAPVIPADLHANKNAQHLYQQGLSTVPTKNSETKVIVASFSYESQQLQLQLSHAEGWDSPQILIDGDEVSDDYFSQPIININKNIMTATFKVTNWLGKTDLVDKSITITVSDALFSHELKTRVDNKTLFESGSSSLLTMIAFALLGGLILNIMPCVLPVLGMKLNSMLASRHASKRTIRLQFLASAAGILTSFWLLAIALLILKFTGNAIGWGIQFQNPLFIGFMVIITALFTANLLGLFELRLPSRFSTSVASKGDDSTFGHFIQGMFATLLATPCSAPFLGTAVAFALGASVFEMWMVFTFLGLGMALPWLLLALFPSLVSLLPKPGAWMNKVKVIFGLMMLITTLWLLSLLTPFIGTFPTLMIALLLLVYLLYKIAKTQGKNTVIVILAVTVAVSSAGLAIASLTSKHWATPLQDNLNWQPLYQHSIDDYVKQGKTVFVNVTADWCITCKTNKIGVILQDPVYSALQQDNVVVMKGDWTRPSDKVTNFLKSHGRFGVPLNVVYGPNAPSGIRLPVLLKSDDVIKALQSAGSSNNDN
ncbi:protein-disulfide reductase DsbD family protein [Psychromonas hadalis]|uniref:protein-disulfide reductase DsbD family protein n=1 Tax=Psychromonas hadalis TaxID=211669 RepID=UPI0003B59819|nr:protein-disulfide reductase DsbD domain-containing protein [Psychromonas hadalis]